MKNLNEMTSKELKEIAKGLKISNWWNLKKEVLIAKIEEVQNMSDEEKQVLAEQKAKEDAAIKEYTKNWAKYTKTYNPIEFMEKFRSGKITLGNEEPEAEEEIIEETEEQHTIDSQPEANEGLSAAVKTNLKNAYNWILGGNENSVADGEVTDAEFEEWIKNNALIEIYNEAISSAYGEDYAGGKPPKGMKSADKKLCLEYLIGLFKRDDYEVEMPGIKAGHAPTPKRGALIEFDGKAQNICAWGEELGISPNTLYGRIYKMGWSVEKAFTTPSRKK